MASNINGLSSFNLRHTTAHGCTQIINEQPPQQPPDFRRDTLGRDLPRSSSKSYSDPDGFWGSSHPETGSPLCSPKRSSCRKESVAVDGSSTAIG